MPDKSVLTSSLFWRSFISLLIGAQLVITAMAVFRIGETNTLREKVAAVEIEHKDLRDKYRALSDELKGRVDELESVLFGDVLAKVEKNAKVAPRFNKVEQWMLNRTKELTEKVNQLERWRLRVEGRDQAVNELTNKRGDKAQIVDGYVIINGSRTEVPLAADGLIKFDEDLLHFSHQSLVWIWDLSARELTAIGQR